MTHMKYSFLEKSQFENVAPVLFDILENNMNKIAPTGRTKEENYRYVEAAANKLNTKSIGVLGTLGLKVVGELHNGSCVQLRGDFADLIKWYRKK